MELSGMGAGRMEMPGARGAGREGAPGQVAKMAVKMAAEAGAELPPNAKGLAASAIAKGADPESVFAAMIPPAEPAPEPAPDTGDGGMVSEGEESAMV